MSDDPGQIDAPFASAESALDDYDEQYSQGGSFDDFNISLIERCSDLESWLNGRGDDGDFVPEDLSDEPELLTDPHLDFDDLDVSALYVQLVEFSKSSSPPFTMEFKGSTTKEKDALEAFSNKLGLLFSHDIILDVVVITKTSGLSTRTSALNPDHNQFEITTNPPGQHMTSSPMQDDFGEIAGCTIDTPFQQKKPRDLDNQTPPGYRMLESSNAPNGTFPDVAFDAKQHEISGTVSPKSLGPLMDTVYAGIKTLGEVGACWRCKILRKKCDPENPCKACPITETRSAWNAVGCKRGTLSEQPMAITLCPNALCDTLPERVSYITGQQIGEHLLAAMNGRLQLALANLVAILKEPGDTLQKIVLEILYPAVKRLDLSSSELDRIIRQDMLLCIIWGVVDNPSAKTVLGIQSLESASRLLIAATSFETEYGDTSLISLSVECLRHCVDILRLHHDGLLAPLAHETCYKGHCKIDCIDNLVSTITRYMDELSRVLLRRENLQNDRRWWLSTFYSLYIQAHVRRGLITIESRINPPSQNSSTANQPSTEYLHIAVQLFTAAAAGYDPLGLEWNLEEPPELLRSDLRLLKYYRLAQTAVEVWTWAKSDINSSFSYLAKMFELGLPQDRAELPSTLGQKRRATSPLSNYTLIPNLTSFPPLALPSHESSSQPDYDSVQPLSRGSLDLPLPLPLPLPSPRYNPGLPGLLDQSTSARLRRQSRNSSPSSRASFDYRRRSITSIATPGTIHRNTSNESLSALRDTISSWSIASIGSRSPVSAYSGDHLPSRSSPPLLRGLPFSTSPRLSLFRKHSVSTQPNITPPRHSAENMKPTTAKPKTYEHITCGCCPKKPKKFLTMEELSAHEAEKQYECSFCGNRFKNKNEAERHQNSLHVRRHSWSCSAIQGYDRVFHESPDQPGMADTCGYCGEEFPRTGHGPSGPGGLQYATEADWDDRIRHLQEVHKFRECNASKKFYRADHFRQHLKHSHGGTSGKWTNMLENACMMEEELPMPR